MALLIKPGRDAVENRVKAIAAVDKEAGYWS